MNEQIVIQKTNEIISALKEHPTAKFNVFRHQPTDEGIYRIDVRRNGTYSPFCYADHCFARVSTKSKFMAEHIEKKFRFEFELK